jgi:hypothetical protein
MSGEQCFHQLKLAARAGRLNADPDATEGKRDGGRGEEAMQPRRSNAWQRSYALPGGANSPAHASRL